MTSQADNDNEPEWVARFLTALLMGRGTRAAAAHAGVASSTPYHRRKTDPEFRAAWDSLQRVDGRRARHAGPRRPRHASRTDRFLHELAETSNVARAAAVADLTVSHVYRLRRDDPSFAAKWYAALAEGYDNLEMELLAHLRGKAEVREGDPPFDTAAALRCLAAHRDAVTREKGRRTLAQEVATIEAINARIDALRVRRAENDRAIAAARDANAGRASGDERA